MGLSFQLGTIPKLSQAKQFLRCDNLYTSKVKTVQHPQNLTAPTIICLCACRTTYQNLIKSMLAPEWQ